MKATTCKICRCAE